MTWSYSGDPSTSNKDQVRYLVGDVTQNVVYSLNDAEVNFAITQANDSPANLYHVAADVADRMATRALQQVTTSRKLGDLEVAENYQQVATALRKLSEQLMKGRAKFHPGLPVFQDQNTNQFAVGMMDDISGFGPGVNLTSSFWQ